MSSKKNTTTSAPVVTPSETVDTGSRGPGRRPLADTLKPVVLQVLTELGAQHPIKSDLISSTEKACRTNGVKATFVSISKYVEQLKTDKVVRTYSDKDFPDLERVCLSADFPI